MCFLMLCEAMIQVGSHTSLWDTSNDLWMIDVLIVQKSTKVSKNYMTIHVVPSTHGMISADLHGTIALPPMVGRQNQQVNIKHNCTACLNTITFLWDVLDIPS